MPINEKQAHTNRPQARTGTRTLTAPLSGKRTLTDALTDAPAGARPLARTLALAATLAMAAAPLSAAAPFLTGPAEAALLPAFYSSTTGSKWGFFAHKKINRTAVFTLPAEMLRFYKGNLEDLTLRAVNPDKRRYIIEEEAARHYFDTEYYGADFLEQPLPPWGKLREMFPADTFRENGVLPWHILRVTRRLTQAFTDRDSAAIIRHSADLGHYLADAHVPLHTTRNYNGQLTGQTGIHAFWESRIPELFAHRYDLLTGKARYIPDLRTFTREIIKGSHQVVDSVLRIEKKLSETFPSDRKYTVYLKNNRTVKNYSRQYATRYRHQLQEMIARRMKKSILAVGSYWFTAWVNAGQPVLNGLEDQQPDSAPQDVSEKANHARPGAKMLGRQEQ